MGLNNLLVGANVKGITEAQKLAYSNLIQTIVSGAAVGVNMDSIAGQQAARVELENNWLFSWERDKLRDQKSDALVLCRSGHPECKKLLSSIADLEVLDATRDQKTKVIFKFTKNGVDFGAVFIPQLRGVSMFLTVGEVSCELTYNNDVLSAIKTGSVELIGKTLEIYMPAFRYVTPSERDTIIEAVKYTADKITSN